MEPQKLPPGWDDARVRRVLTHYEQQSDDDAASEDDAAYENRAQAIMEVPHELVPAVRNLLAKHGKVA